MQCPKKDKEENGGDDKPNEPKSHNQKQIVKDDVFHMMILSSCSLFMKLLFQLGRGTRDITKDCFIRTNGIIFHEERKNGRDAREHGGRIRKRTLRLRSSSIEHEKKGALGVGDLLVHGSVLP